MKQKIERNKTLDYIFRFLSYFSITDVIWVLYMSYKGLPLRQIGIAEGIFHITGLLSEVPTGALAFLDVHDSVIPGNGSSGRCDWIKSCFCFIGIACFINTYYNM